MMRPRVIPDDLLHGTTTGSAVWLAVVFLVALLALLLGLVLARFLRGAASRGRNRVAQGGEAEAETILARAGYRIVSRQTRASSSFVVDGEELSFDVRADLIVSRDGERYVAEVKTGAVAPDPRHPATRRQLLEYALIFGAREVLLVDVPAGAVRVVSFGFDEALPVRG